MTMPRHLGRAGASQATRWLPESSGRAAKRAICRLIPRCVPAMIRTHGIHGHSGVVGQMTCREFDFDPAAPHA
jgi:hypothetical protein